MPVDTWCFSRIHTTFGRCRRKYCKQLIMEPRIELATCLFVLPTTFYWLIIAPQKPATQPPRPAPLVPLTVFGNLHLFTLCVIIVLRYNFYGLVHLEWPNTEELISRSLVGLSIKFLIQHQVSFTNVPFQKLCWKVSFPERRKEFPR